MKELREDPIRLPNLSVMMRTVRWNQGESVVLRPPGYQVSRQIGGHRGTATRCQFQQENAKPLANLAFVPADRTVPLEMSAAKRRSSPVSSIAAISSVC